MTDFLTVLEVNGVLCDCNKGRRLTVEVWEAYGETGIGTRSVPCTRCVLVTINAGECEECGGSGRRLNDATRSDLLRYIDCSTCGGSGKVTIQARVRLLNSGRYGYANETLLLPVEVVEP